MRTKLSVFCDRVLETGWLLAAILAPLYFNVLSSRVFEPDKLALVRSIALVMVAAWLIKVIDSSTWGNPSGQASRPRPSGVETARPGFWKRLTSVPLVVPTLFLVASYLLSTILSIAPEISLWGSYMRLQGTYTTYSYIVIFFLMPTIVMTGMTMSPAITAAYPFLLKLFFGAQSARTIHFMTSIALILFLIAHIVMVAKSGIKQQMRAMTIGK